MKHILEIPENVQTALVTMRDDKGNIVSGVAKGQPHYTESLALAFGTFVSMIKALEEMNGPEVRVCEDIREIVKEFSLEEVRLRLGDVANSWTKKGVRNETDGDIPQRNRF
jgi:hypothetical protein